MMLENSKGEQIDIDNMGDNTSLISIGTMNDIGTFECTEEHAIGIIRILINQFGIAEEDI